MPTPLRKQYYKNAEQIRHQLIVGTSIFLLRKKHDRTQAELAKKLDTTAQIIDDIENGDHELNEGILHKLAKSLDTKQSKLITLS